MNATLQWIEIQLKSPSTHAVLTAVAAAALPYIPAPYGTIAVAVFAVLGIVLPEAGETTAPKPPAA